MGRSSRAKRERRNDPERSQRRAGVRAEQRGRRVAPTPAAFATAYRNRGTDGVAEALISRHNQRWEAVMLNSPRLGDGIIEVLHVLYPMDVLLAQLGVDRNRFPPSATGDWPSHLAWGVDSSCQAARMLLAGNVLGAAAIARGQLERWTGNLASALESEQSEGETTAEFFSRVWNQGHPGTPDAGRIWTELSELVHGRGPLLDELRWDVIDLASAERAASFVQGSMVVSDSIALALLQVRHCALAAAEEKGLPHGYLRAIHALPLRLPSEIDLKFAGPLYWPLNFDHLGRNGSALTLQGERYASDVAACAGRRQTESKRYSERAVEAFAWRRARAAFWAVQAMRDEEAVLGPSFGPSKLSSREIGYVLLNEALGVAARWQSGPVSDALATAGGAFRAAYWLWLEDDDRSMAVARTALEQSARARVWRLKPHRAEVLEQRGSRTSTRDWLEEAGWRRLSALNRSLGEFAHASVDSKWTGARAVLVDLQTDSDLNDSVEPEVTARGSALNRIAGLLGSETLANLRELSPDTSAAFAELLPELADGNEERAAEEWLSHVWRFRTRGFGESDFTSP